MDLEPNIIGRKKKECGLSAHQLLRLGDSGFSYPFIFGDEECEVGMKEKLDKGTGAAGDSTPCGHMAPSLAFLLRHLPEVPSQKTGQGNTEV